MQDDPRETAARKAIDAGDWQTARDLFETLAQETNAPEAWAGLAEAAWLQQDSRLMIDARLTAYRLHRERGNDVAAARMAIALGNDFLDFRGDAAVANGWFKYARRLLKPLPPSAEHAWLNAWEARLALIGRQDTAEGARLAEEALCLARESNCPDVEVLATAMSGLALVMNAQPEILNHNVETVPRIFKSIRPGFRYDRSLSVLRAAHDFGLVTKSNLILGMGETRAEVSATLYDLYSAGARIITITQYLRPSPRHHPVNRWVRPEEFVELKAEAEQIGFAGVMSGPLVRSSYRAGRLYRQAMESSDALATTSPLA